MSELEADVIASEQEMDVIASDLEADVIASDLLCPLMEIFMRNQDDP